jgi:hypothetical protein
LLLAALFVANGCVDLTKPWDHVRPTDAAADAGGAPGGGGGSASGGTTSSPVGGSLGGGGATVLGQGGAAGATVDAEPFSDATIDVPPSGSGGMGEAGQGGIDGGSQAQGGAAGATIDAAVDGAGGAGTPDLALADLAEVIASRDTADGTRDLPLERPADLSTEAPADARDAASEQVSTVGLIAYYACEGTGGSPGTTLVDLSGRGNHGTIAVGPPPATGGTGGSPDGATGTGGTSGTPIYSYAAGKVGNGLTLSGAANSYVELPAGLLASAQEMTIAAWVKPTTTTAFQRVFDFSTDTTNFMYLTTANSGDTAARFRIATPGGPTADGGASQVLEGTAPVPTGVWTHLALVLDSTGASLYVNGALQATSPAVTLRPADLGSTTSDYIGRSAFPKDPYFDGAVDEYRIYGRALSATEIAILASGN